MDILWDCVIVGGGAAGLSAGLVLGRARRRTLIMDAGQQSNLGAHGIGELLGSDGRPPAELYAAGRVELSAYPSVEIRGGETVRARRVLLATGMQYRPPPLPGLAELWGRSAFHCPFCHGWEVRDQPLAVLAAGERAVHSALLLRGWSDDIVVLTDGPAELSDDSVARLAAAGVSVDERPVAELRSAGGVLTAVVFADGGQLPRAGLLVGTTLYQRSTLAQQLGADAAEPGSVAADAVHVDAFARTTAPGVFAAGDISAQMPQVAAAVAGGSLAGAMIMRDLMGIDSERFGLPLPTGGDSRVGTR